MEKAAEEHFGKNKWKKISEGEKQIKLNKVVEKYQDFFATVPRGYIKPPHLLDQIKTFLKYNFEIEEKNIEKLYHPSQIAIYSNTEDQILLKSPKTAAFKNPMAYKTLHHLRRVINHLIEIGKIDNETGIVVEIARDLNDKNKRAAIEAYQRRREAENKEFAIAISELLKDPEFNGEANPESKRDKEKFRLWIEQIENKDAVFNNIFATKEDIKKYRLWKEQNCQCIYTGKIIRLTDLFNPNTVDFEHTIPRSKSFDNSLANLTVCYADYNRNIKKNRIPTELENYNDEALGYTAIFPRLEKWQNRVDEFKEQVDFWRFQSKIAGDKERKDYAIRQMHLRTFEYDYWKNKVDRFKREDVPQGFVNSQLTDTQTITKYAFHYLKTVFNQVEVQKGDVTAQFRKIYGIQEKAEKKDRTKHHHHAVDAAVLTLIPQSAKREEILKKAYEYEEKTRKQYHEKPFPSFHQSMIIEIEKTLLVNNIPNKDQALTKGEKIVRRRGKIVWLRDDNGKIRLDINGNKIPKIAQGDSIRGQLHQDTFYGKIRITERDENNNPIRDGNNNWKFSEGKDEFKFVLRTPIENITSLKQIVDPHLAQMIEKQMNGRSLAKTISDGVFMLNKKGEKENRIRRVRTWVRSSNLLSIKEQTYKSKYDYKNYYYADTGDNYAFALYISKDGKKKIVSQNLFEISQTPDKSIIKNIEDLFEPKIFLTKTKTANLYHVFQKGQKVLFYENDKDELKDVDNLSDRLYYVNVLFDAKQGLIQFQHHLEARDNKQLLLDFPEKDDNGNKKFGKAGVNGFSVFSTDFYRPRLLLSPNNLICIIEGKDFIMSLDGRIEFLY